MNDKELVRKVLVSIENDIKANYENEFKFFRLWGKRYLEYLVENKKYHNYENLKYFYNDYLNERKLLNIQD